MPLEELIQNYKPSDETIAILQKSHIVLLVGIVAAGKDTIKRKLLEKPDYHKVVNYTTRAPRVNNGVLEQDGIDYHYISRGDMQQRVEQRQMIEVNKFGSNFYGSSVDEFVRTQAEGKIALADIDVNGIASYRKLAPEAITALFIVPPSYEEWRNRLEKRYTSEETFSEEWQQRRDLTITELEQALELPYYHFVINDSLDEAVARIDALTQLSNGANADDEARQAAQLLLDRIRSAN